ncbi:aldehyde dehydrogenase [Radicibacter daui]|uniref:aldehyde dehydrogenase n=1 Tax=Radicibacter daui TaxID=3064829 RepID=UPI004046CBB3
MTYSRDFWLDRAETLSPRTGMFINGRLAHAADGDVFEDLSPVDGRVLGAVASGKSEDIDRAVKAARKAFDGGHWSRRHPRERKKVMLAWAALIEKHAEELALLETLDMGKPISDALAVDVPATVGCIRWYAEAIDKVYGEVAPTDPEKSLALILREPMGVIGVVVPWNFPMIMSAWKLGPALATGNSVVLKPAEQSPLTAIRLAELAVEAGIPEGVFNVVTGYGETAGRALGLHPDVDAIGFTGSTEVGKLFLQYSGQSNMKRVYLECGGKSPNIVLADCPDVKAAARASAGSMFFNGGEMCTAPSRLLVQKGIEDELMEEVAKVAAATRPGHPLDPSTSLGALVSPEHAERVMSYIEIGRQDGAKLIAGGKRVVPEGIGANESPCYVEPTVFAGATNSMRIAQEEIFGPVLTAIPFNDVDDAIRIANDTQYGLAGAVWTRDIDKAIRVSRAVRSGMVYVNSYDADDITVPFGGYKQSGFGRDKSLHALEKYTDLKTVWIALGS